MLEPLQLAGTCVKTFHDSSVNTDASHVASLDSLVKVAEDNYKLRSSLLNLLHKYYDVTILAWRVLRCH